MKAYVLHDINDLALEERTIPDVPAGWELVKVKAAGICGSDIPRIYQTGAHRHPLVPGHEFSGQVVTRQVLGNRQEETAGAKQDPGSHGRMAMGISGCGGDDWEGKRVGVFPLIPCGECLCCRRKKYEMCRNYNYLGSRCDGAFAEYAAVPRWNLIELPDQVSFEQAAMLEPMAVAVHAMRSASPGPTDTVAVLGLGTIGLLLVMFLQRLGVKKILALGNKDFQRECTRRFSEIIFADIHDVSVREWVLEQTDGQGADVFFECVGKNETLVHAIDAAAPGAVVQLVGNPYSDMVLEKALYWKILRNQLKVLGTWNSSFTHSREDDWHYVLDLLAAGQVRPEEFITHKLDFTDLEKGLGIMRDKGEDYVKVMIENR